MTNPLAEQLDNIVDRTDPLWGELRGGRILITGATGFFGCWLLESFAWANQRLKLNAQAIALSRNPAAFAQKAPHLAANPAITLHAADVRHGDFPRGELSHLIHAATEASARLNGEEPLTMFDTIVEGTRRTMQFASAANVARFLFVSSGAVYGTQPPELSHVSESFSGGPDPLDRGSAYAEGKRAAEMLCTLAASSRMTTTIARCFAFVGPYMQTGAHFAIGNFISDALRGTPLHVTGDGTAVRSYLYASDLTVWLWTTLFKGRSGRAYNVGSEDALNIAALANEVNAAVPNSVGVHRVAPPATGVSIHRYVPSTARAREELGLSAEIPLREAIRRTYTWFAEKQTPADTAGARGACV